MSTTYLAKLTSKAQTTLPLAVRKALCAKPGDTLVYTVGPEGVRVAKAEPLDIVYLQSLDRTLGEWGTREDAAAYDDL